MITDPLGPAIRALEPTGWGRTDTTRSVRWAGFLLSGIAVAVLIACRRSRATVPIEAPISGRFVCTLDDGALLVRVGDPIGFIEGADGMAGEITTPLAGRVARIVAENGAAVEYGQPLMHVEPTW